MTRMTGPDCAVMRNLINTHTHTQVSLIPLGRPDCAVMSNLINTHTHTRKQGGEHKVLRAQVRFVQVERVCPLCRV